MTALYDAQLRDIAEAVTLVSDETARVTTPDGAAQEVAVANERGAYLGLAEALYATRYNAPREPIAAVPQPDPDGFLTALRIANALPQRWQRGAPLPRETITSRYGHYVVHGPQMHDASTGRQVRFYWNLDLSGATAFVRELSLRFGRARIPFQAKLPVHPAGYARTDTGVLYLGDDDVEASLDAILATHAGLGSAVRREVPWFTLPLAPGLAFAESPPNGDSFGMHRCDLIAEGLVRAYAAGAGDANARFAAIRDRLIAYGLDVERLAFNPTSKYPYRFAAFDNAA